MISGQNKKIKKDFYLIDPGEKSPGTHQSGEKSPDFYKSKSEDEFSDTRKFKNKFSDFLSSDKDSSKSESKPKLNQGRYLAYLLSRSPGPVKRKLYIGLTHIQCCAQTWRNKNSSVC